MNRWLKSSLCTTMMLSIVVAGGRVSHAEDTISETIVNTNTASVVAPVPTATILPTQVVTAVPTPDQSVEQPVLKLDSVVVTAQKKEEEAFDVPGAITTLNAEHIADMQIDELADLSHVAANVHISDPGFSGAVMPVVRGFYSMAMDAMSTGIYQDGIFVGRFLVIPPVFYNLERIEILKGPQGTLYGRNTMGGVINMVSKEPEDRLSGSLTTSYGTYKDTVSNGVISIPFESKKAVLQLGGYYKEFDGFYKNAVLDNKQTGGEVFGAGNVMLKVKPAEDREYTIKYDYSQRREELYPYHGSKETAEKDPYTIYHTSEGVFENQGHNGVFKTMVDVGDIQLINIMGVSLTDSEFNGMDTDYSAADLYSHQGTDDSFGANNEFRISSDMPAVNLNWIAGLFAAYETRDQKRNMLMGADAGPMMAGMGKNNHLIQHNVIGSLFGQATYTLIDNLDITAGLRYDYEKKNTDVTMTNMYRGMPMGSSENYLNEAHFTAVTPKFAIAYNYNDIIKPFMSISKGYQAGGINVYSHLPGKIEYDPEYSWNYEVGVKSKLLDNRLNINGSFFYSQWKDQQIMSYFGPTEYGVQNAGSSNIVGAELEVAALMGYGINIDATVGFNQPTLEDFNAETYNMMTGMMEEYDLAGKTNLYTPLATGVIGVQYSNAFSVSKTITLKPLVRIEATYTGKQYYNLHNTMVGDPYTLMNANVGVGINDFDLMFWIKNIADERYDDYNYDNIGSPIIRKGDPRTMGVKVSYNF